MPKINQGKYEVFTTKEDAINKFMQMQGICRERISGENPIEFSCNKKGKIVIANPSSNRRSPRRRTADYNSTNLYAEVLEESGKVYVNYYTEFSVLNQFSKCFYFAIYLLMGIFSIVLAVVGKYEFYYLPILFLGLIFSGIQIFSIVKEKKNSPKDSETLIKVLENRVKAVNLWDK